MTEAARIDALRRVPGDGRCRILGHYGSYDSLVSPGLSASERLRHTPAGIRVAITASIGVAVGAIVSAFTSWQAAILIPSGKTRAFGCPNSSFFPRGSLCSPLWDWSSSELARQSVEPRPT